MHDEIEARREAFENLTLTRDEFSAARLPTSDAVDLLRHQLVLVSKDDQLLESILMRISPQRFFTCFDQLSSVTETSLMRRVFQIWLDAMSDHNIGGTPEVQFVTASRKREFASNVNRCMNVLELTLQCPNYSRFASGKLNEKCAAPAILGVEIGGSYPFGAFHFRHIGTARIRHCYDVELVHGLTLIDTDGQPVAPRNSATETVTHRA